MTRFLGVRGVAAAGALLLSLVGGSTEAHGQVVTSALVAQSFDLRAMPLPMVQAIARGADPAATLITPPPGVTTTLPPGGSALVQPEPSPNPSTLSLSAMVDANSDGDLDEQANCLATAVYFESKGESLKGQLAVAQVVINRAASGRYPASLCGVVKQKAQFSFVRNGVFPSHDPTCDGWRKARAIARIAQKRLVPTVPTDVLWYHANYVAPRWRQTLTRVEQIGAHIFYRA